MFTQPGTFWLYQTNFGGRQVPIFRAISSRQGSPRRRLDLRARHATTNPPTDCNRDASADTNRRQGRHKGGRSRAPWGACTPSKGQGPPRRPIRSEWDLDTQGRGAWIDRSPPNWLNTKPWPRTG